MQEPSATFVPKGPAEQRIEAEFGEPVDVLIRRWYFVERLTQEQIAERLSVSNATVSRLFTKYGIVGRHPREFKAPEPASVL